jgi:hypothetical protein
MRNEDIERLYDLVDLNTKVVVFEWKVRVKKYIYKMYALDEKSGILINLNKEILRLTASGWQEKWESIRVRMIHESPLQK